jgi:hypothetical protein
MVNQFGSTNRENACVHDSLTDEAAASVFSAVAGRGNKVAPMNSDEPKPGKEEATVEFGSLGTADAGSLPPLRSKPALIEHNE